MSLKQKRIIWYLVWLLILLSGPFTVIKNTDLSQVTSNDILLVSLFQRLTGVTAFTLLFIQITLGAYMDKWFQILGAKAYWVHVTEGLFAYAFVLIHPLMQTYLDFSVRGILGAILTFLPGLNIYLTFGKIGFLLLTVGVVAGYFRTKPFFRRNWRTFHILNYIAFFFVASHSLNLGTDVASPPFVIVHKGAILGVTIYVINKIYPLLTKKFASAKLIIK